MASSLGAETVSEQYDTEVGLDRTKFAEGIYLDEDKGTAHCILPSLPLWKVFLISQPSIDLSDRPAVY